MPSVITSLTEREVGCCKPIRCLQVPAAPEGKGPRGRREPPRVCRGEELEPPPTPGEASVLVREVDVLVGHGIFPQERGAKVQVYPPVQDLGDPGALQRLAVDLHEVLGRLRPVGRLKVVHPLVRRREDLGVVIKVRDGLVRGPLEHPLHRARVLPRLEDSPHDVGQDLLPEPPGQVHANSELRESLVRNMVGRVAANVGHVQL
mmetsp:Transcript_2815/g.10456  ORF Transcript_2815/g.10456 Transcript_2815/m.10456 type:complete len:204 (-) Transcript_2815:6-617(-)